jgi:adenosylcobinamide-GDP ribazoletransferase
VRGFLGAVSLLTRVPARADASTERSIPWLPLVGALIGACCAGVYAAARPALPSGAAATLAVAAGVLLTGALHEDGLADTADGFGTGADRERTLEILKDPRHGTYGVLAIVLSVAARIAAVAGMDPAGAAVALPAAHALGRTATVGLMWILPSANATGLGGRYAAGVERRRVLAAAASAVAVAAGLLGLWGLGALAVAMVASAGVGALAMRKIGGITGDVLGAAEQVVEIAVLLLAAAAGHGIPWFARG